MDAQKELARAYATIGKYDEAENAARRATAAKNGGALWNAFGEVLLLRGKRAAAESAFVRAGAGAPDSLTAALNLAILHFDRGDRDRAMKEFDRFIDVYNKSGGAALTERRARRGGARGRISRRDQPAALQGCAQGVRPRDLRRPERTSTPGSGSGSCSSASTTSTTRRRRSPTSSRRIRASRARCSARLDDSQADGQGGDSLLRASLKRQSRLRGRAHAARRDAASGSRITPRRSRTSIARSRSIQPRRTALAVAAGVKYLTHDQPGFEAIKQRTLALYPKDAEFYTTLSELASQVRLYKAAADFAPRRRGARHQEVAGVGHARHEPAAPRPDRRREEEPGRRVCRRPVQRLGQEHARSARHVQELRSDHERPLPVHDREGRIGDSLDLPEGSRRAGVRDVREAIQVHAAAADSDRGVSAATRTSRCARLVWPGSARSA